MSALYEMTSDLQALYESITVGEDGAIDQETIETIERMQIPWREKVLAIARLVKNLDAEAKKFAEHILVVTARKRRIEEQIERLKAYLRDNMDALGETSIDGDLIKVRLVRNSQPSVCAQSLRDVPPLFFFQPEPQLDKKRCLEHHKRGELVPGVEFILGKHVRIV